MSEKLNVSPWHHFWKKSYYLSFAEKTLLRAGKECTEKYQIIHQYRTVLRVVGGALLSQAGG
jgi:hypothetical protein